jgi:hypothetical protein
MILLLVMVTLAPLVTPAHAQVTITALDWATTTAQMGAVVVNHVRVTNIDPINIHSVTLSIVGYPGGWWWGSFSPATLNVPPGGGFLDSTLTIPLPGPADVCPTQNTPGPYYIQLAVQGNDPALGTITGPTLTVNLLPAVSLLSVNVEASKASYMKGETVTLRMEANLPAEYYLVVKKPDGGNWATAQGYLPATFTKKASDPLGTYTVELTGTYCGTARDTTSFTVTPDTYEVTVSLSGLPPDATTGLLVDGNKATDMKGGDVKVLSYPIGTSHTFQVDQYVNGATGYRYYCESNSWTATGAASNAFSYTTQVYLDVSTDPAGITDVTTSGWYAKGTSTSVASVSTEVEKDQGTKYVFLTWTVDGTPRGDNGFVVVMDAPHKVVAKYDTMFLLTIVSDYGNPTGAGYYKSGETATFSVDSPVGIGIQRVFAAWTGDYTGNNPKGSITMDGPKTVTATWNTDYIQFYIIVGAIAAVAVIAGLLLWMRRRRGPTTVKAPPPPPPPPPTPEVVPTPTESPSTSSTVESGSKPAVTVAIRCTNCGHELKEGQVFCPECGQKQID